MSDAFDPTTASEAEWLVEAMEVLEPFALAADEMLVGLADSTGLWVPTVSGGDRHGIYVGHMRRARALVTAWEAE